MKVVSFLFLISISSNFQILIAIYTLDARALFKRVIPNFSADRARPLWERWAQAALKLEKRMAEVYASGMIFFLFSMFLRSDYFV